VFSIKWSAPASNLLGENNLAPLSFSCLGGPDSLTLVLGSLATGQEAKALLFSEIGIAFERKCFSRRPAAVAPAPAPTGQATCVPSHSHSCRLVRQQSCFLLKRVALSDGRVAPSNVMIRLGYVGGEAAKRG
jgi:hypothetical protein